MIRWNVSPSVPDLSLPRVNLDAAVIPEVLPQNVMDLHCPLGLRDDVDVVVESKEALIAEAEIGLSGGLDVAPKRRAWASEDRPALLLRLA